MINKNDLHNEMFELIGVDFEMLCDLEKEQMKKYNLDIYDYSIITNETEFIINLYRDFIEEQLVIKLQLINFISNRNRYDILINKSLFYKLLLNTKNSLPDKMLLNRKSEESKRGIEVVKTIFYALNKVIDYREKEITSEEFESLSLITGNRRLTHFLIEDLKINGVKNGIIFNKEQLKNTLNIFNKYYSKEINTLAFFELIKDEIILKLQKEISEQHNLKKTK